MIVKYPNNIKAKVLITGPINHKLLEEFKEVAEFHIWDGKKKFLMPPERLNSIIADYDAIVNFAEVSVNKDLVKKAHSLKIIANATIGFDNIDLQLLTQNNIWATNVPGIFSYPVAEYVLACLLMLLRKINEADKFVRRNEWKKFEPGRWDGISLKEKTLGIVGLGSIGKELRKISLSLGVNTIYFDPFIQNEEGWVPFSQLIKQSDIISVHIPLNTKTFKLFDKKTIYSTKEGAILVNTARGTVIEETALVEALQTGRLGGAVLDVFEREPDVPDALKKMHNVILTPHIAGGTKTARNESLRLALKNVAEVLLGRSPINPLNTIK